MMTSISTLSGEHLGAVDELMKRNSGTVGFLPLEALKDYLEKGWVLGALTSDGHLKGYLLYAANRDRFRITQLCVSDDFRNQGLARSLIEALKKSATTQTVIRLTCRNDFPAHSIWPRLGFVALVERTGRSNEGLPLTLWRQTLAVNDQLALFRANVSESVIDVIIDAQVFFDFDEPESDANRPSKVLISDSFADTINIWYTDELYNEINRNEDADERRDARRRAGDFLEVNHDPISADIHSDALNQLLPRNTASQQSDINHLAKAASSDIDAFVTRDRGILNKADEIAKSVNLRVLSPTELIIKLEEVSEAQGYEPIVVSGLGLRWRRLNSQEFAGFPFDRFIEQDEAVWRLKERVGLLLADPDPHDVEVLWSGNEPVALRGLAYRRNGELEITLGRVALAHDRSLFGRFLVSDAIYRAAKQSLEMVKMEVSSIPAGLIKGLSDMGFRRYGNQLVRFCFTRYLDRDELLDSIRELCPEIEDCFRVEPISELERLCSPLPTLFDQKYFLIPIREGYAINLFDRQQAERDLFGGNPDVLLRWENVYYRAATHHNMLTAPARVLWYVSRNRQEVAYVSRLDQVIIGKPKELFREFRRYGTLEWADLYEMCGQDVDTNLMALRFSHTFPLNRSIPLNTVWEVFDEESLGKSVQAPTRLPRSAFLKLFELGFPEEQ